ncbi:MAG TPA: flagellar hook-length control protein FliK [Burkholderiaceae bacterium]|nr:flagellar hook-length control protein FliK [Burkholderiaceae bacterium]
MDLGAIAAAILRPGAPIGPRDDRIVVSLRLVGSLLDGRATLAEISPDLANEVRSAAADARATLILPAGPGPARIDLAGRQFVLAPALRDALIALLSGGESDSAPPASANAGGAPPAANAPLQLATQALVLAAAGEDAVASATVANQLAAAGTPRAARNDAGETVAYEEPVFDPRFQGQTADRLAARVSGSGVFFEAHVAQALRGDRSVEAVQGEAQRLARGMLADPEIADARTSVQLDVLQKQAIALSGPAWAGQPMLLELARDPQVLPDGHNGPAAESTPVFVARLKLDLPRLGSTEIRLRLAGEAVAATIASRGAGAARGEFEQALPEFAAALTARGLRPVLLQTVGAEEAA